MLFPSLHLTCDFKHNITHAFYTSDAWCSTGDLPGSDDSAGESELDSESDREDEDDIEELDLAVADQIFVKVINGVTTPAVELDRHGVTKFDKGTHRTIQRGAAMHNSLGLIADANTLTHPPQVSTLRTALPYQRVRRTGS